MKRFNQNEIEELAQILNKDGVISVPTDTVYGLCARISSKQAHDNLIAVKNRPINKLFPIMCADEEQIRSIAIVNENAEKLIKAFMPGPITLVMNARKDLAEYINNGGKTIAVRMATSPVLKELIKKVDSPVFMSSANQSGEPTCTSLDELEKLCPKIDAMMEGDVSFRQASTIIDCSTQKVNVLREGPITIEQIREVL